MTQVAIQATRVERYSMTKGFTRWTPSARASKVQGVCQALAGVSAFLLVALVPHASSAGNPKLAPYSKAPEAEKISLNLLQLEQDIRHQHLSLTRAAASRALATQGHGLRLDILTRHLNAHVEAELVQAGAQILHLSPSHQRVTVSVQDPAVIHQLARIPDVLMISPDYGATVYTGSVDGRASEAMQADLAKLATGFSGSGQTIGILSDSFARSGGVRDATTTPAAGNAGPLRNSRPQQSGDLPPTVTLRNDSISGTDEGAAMAELVHDVAPGAAIAFHTAFTGQAGFADGITDLCTTAGATVVVDDVIYFAEPMYQDGIIAQAAAACVSRGVPYFSSAGNSSNRGFRRLFVDIAAADDDTTVPTGNDLHDWGNGDGFVEVTLPAGGSIRVILQWNQPSASVSLGHGAEIDLDLYVTATPTVAGLASPLARSVNLQGSTGAPRGDAFELVFYRNASAQPQTIYLAVEHFRGNQGMIPQDATTPLEFRLVFFESNASATQIEGITDGSSAFGGPTIYGHAVAEGVVSVGAVPWFETSVFNPSLGASAVTDPESFSSRGGPITIQFDASGSFVLRTSFEPDIAAVDGNNTTFFGSLLNLGGLFNEPDSYPNFFGTSAAAPNAAAVAALLRELNPTLTPADLTAVLVDTAIDITGFRANVGRDEVTGAGLINANAALGALLQEPNGTITAPVGNRTINQGDSLDFRGSGHTPNGSIPLSFRWDFGGGAPNSTLASPGLVTFSTAGTFVVSLTVTDSQGMVDSTVPTLTITVTPPSPGPTATRSSSGGGGGGCTLNTEGGGDFTLVLVLVSILAYLGWKRPRQSSVC